MIPLALMLWVTEPEPRPVAEINSPRDLWMASRWYGLPLPPRDVKLIKL